MNILRWHLQELEGLYERLEENHPAKQRIANRVEECKEEIAVDDLLTELRKESTL